MGVKSVDVITPGQRNLAQKEKVALMTETFNTKHVVNHLCKAMDEVTKKEFTPESVNSACNCVRALNETIHTIIKAAKYFDEK